MEEKFSLKASQWAGWSLSWGVVGLLESVSPLGLPRIAHSTALKFVTCLGQWHLSRPVLSILSPSHLSPVITTSDGPDYSRGKEDPSVTLEHISLPSKYTSQITADIKKDQDVNFFSVLSHGGFWGITYNQQAYHVKYCGFPQYSMPGTEMQCHRLLLTIQVRILEVHPLLLCFKKNTDVDSSGCWAVPKESGWDLCAYIWLISTEAQIQENLHRVFFPKFQPFRNAEIKKKKEYLYL